VVVAAEAKLELEVLVAVLLARDALLFVGGTVLLVSLVLLEDNVDDEVEALPPPDAELVELDNKLLLPELLVLDTEINEEVAERVVEAESLVLNVKPVDIVEATELASDKELELPEAALIDDV
jgi:hypothetical protein